MGMNLQEPNKSPSSSHPLLFVFVYTVWWGFVSDFSQYTLWPCERWVRIARPHLLPIYFIHIYHVTAVDNTLNCWEVFVALKWKFPARYFSVTKAALTCGDVNSFRDAGIYFSMHEPTAFYEWRVRLEARSMPWALSSRSSNYDKCFFVICLVRFSLPATIVWWVWE